jgi:transcription elongation factor GreA
MEMDTSVFICIFILTENYMDNTLQYLEEQISQLRTELSITIPQEIQEIVTLGDLRENTEYSSILERQNFTNVRLEQLLRRRDAYKKVNVSKLPKDVINIGSRIKVRNLNTNEIQYFIIVIDGIYDIEKYEEVTISSPIGQAFKNKKIKDIVSVNAPTGIVQYKILKIDN